MQEQSEVTGQNNSRRSHSQTGATIRDLSVENPSEPGFVVVRNSGTGSNVDRSRSPDSGSSGSKALKDLFQEIQNGLAQEARLGLAQRDLAQELRDGLAQKFWIKEFQKIWL
jgi:hypothetical protein